MHDPATWHRRLEEILTGKLFFIVGVGKSGTTWLQKLLNGHPDIACNGEGHFMDELLPGLQSAIHKYNRTVNDRNHRMYGAERGFALFDAPSLTFLFRTAVALLLDRQKDGRPVSCIGEKTPQNIAALPGLAELFPQARFLHIIRDGRDGAVSGWLHNLRISESATRDKFGDLHGYVRSFAGTWVKQIGMARAFAATHPDRYCELRYEDLHRTPEPVIARILAFLEVAATPELVQGCMAAGAFEKLSGGRQRGEADASSHFRKGIIGDWRQQLDDRAQAIFLDQAGALLKQLGYDGDR